MIIYWVTSSLSAFLAWTLRVRDSENLDLRRLAVYIPILPYLLVAMLRSAVGKDTVGEFATYPRIHRLAEAGYDYQSAFDIIAVEPTYYLLNQAIVALGLDIAVLYAVMSAIFLLFLYRFFLDVSANIPLSLLLLMASDLFLFSLSGIRQAAACGIAFYALKFAYARKPIAFLAWIVIAASFHFTAIVFAIFYALARRRVSAVVATVLVAIVAGLYITPGLVRRFNAIYYGTFYFGSKWDIANFNLIPFAITAVVVGAVWLRSRQIFSENPGLVLYANIMVANLFLMAISPLLITPIRLYYLLIPAAFVLIPAVIKSMPSELRVARAVVSVAFIVLMSLQMVYELAIDNDAYGTWEYHSFFEEWISG